MKTTVEIADPLLLEAKRAAEQDGTTLRELIELGLRRALDERKASASKPFRLRDFRHLTVHMKPRPWFDENDTALMREVANDRLGHFQYPQSAGPDAEDDT